jgi:hypothetical protein
MKNIPKKIYLNLGENIEDFEDFNELGEVTWCVDKVSDGDIEYQRKPIWHDLRKNPDDLPEDFRVVLVIVTIGNTRDIVKVTHTNFAWIGNVLHGSKVIAWIEIPEFKE